MIADGNVHFCRCRCLIWLYIEDAEKTEREDVQNMPSDKGKIQTECMPFVAVHHLAGETKGLFVVHIRLLSKNVRHQKIGIALDDSGDQEKQ